MTNRARRSLVALAAATVALRATAHEVDCSKLAAIALRDPNGTGPLLDPTGLPVLAAQPAPTLTVVSYPALIAFDERIRNLASEPSVISTVADTLAADPTRVLSLGDPLSGTIPVGGALHRVSTVSVTSQADCLAQLGASPAPPAPPAPVCASAWKNTELLVTTDSDIASCRARIRCDAQVILPPPPPPPPPAVCTGPTWSGSLALPLVGVAYAYGDTVTCDGTTWIAGSFADPLSALPLGAVFRLDPAGQLTEIHLDDTQYAVRVDGGGFLDVAGHRRIGNTYGAGAAMRQFDQTGTLRWEYDPSDYAPVSGYPGVDADVDGSSNVYFGYRTDVAGRGGELAIVKLAADGTVVWARQLGTAGEDVLGRIAVSPSGGVFVAGSTTGAFAGQVSAGASDAFLAYLDADGNLVWVRQLGTPGQDLGSAVATDPSGSGRVALVGTTAGPLDGGAVSTSTNAYVAVFDGAGALQWVRELRPTPIPNVPGAAATGDAIAIDLSGAVWVGGAIADGTIPGTTSLGGPDVFVAKYDAAGTYLWGRQFAGNQETSALTHLAVDAAGYGIATENLWSGLMVRSIIAIRLSPDGR